MSHPVAGYASHAFSQRDVLCVQAAVVLRTTAQQWGMCAQAEHANLWPLAAGQSWGQVSCGAAPHRSMAA